MDFSLMRLVEAADKEPAVNHHLLLSPLGSSRFLAFTLISLLLGSASCLADWSWSSATSNLSQTGYNARIPRIASNGSGVAAAIWSRFNGTNWIIQANVFSNSSWQSIPTDISTAGKDASLPQLAVDNNGNARAVWLEAGTTNLIKTSAFNKATGLWGPPLTISNASLSANFPQVALDQAGNAVLVFTQYTGNHWILQSRSLKNGSWLDARTISSSSQDAVEPQISMASDGTFSVIWMGNEGGLTNTIQAVQFRNGLLGNITQLNRSTTNAKFPTITIDDALQTTAVWMETSNQLFQIVSRQLIGGIWGDPTYLSPSALNANAPQIISNGTNNALAIWMQQMTDGTWVIRTRPLTSAGWGSFSDLTATQNAYYPKIAATQSGEATAVWLVQTPTTTTIQGSYFRGGSWTPRQTLSNTSQNATIPDIAMPNDGQAQAIWLRNNGTNEIVQAMTGDYVPSQYSLTVIRSGNGVASSNPSGINCGTTCTASFTQGTQVTLSAAVESGQNFIGWSGPCQGTGTCSVTLNSNLTVSAHFVASSDYQIKIIRPPHGQITSSPEGIVCGLGQFECLKKFGKNTAILLSATPQDGYEFVRWNGCDTPASNQCQMVLNQPSSTLKAVFRAKPKYRLKVSKTRYGKVSSTPGGLQCGNNSRSCSHSFVTGTEVTLTATPQEGREFVGWNSGCNGNTICRITVIGPTSIDATFK